MIRYQGIGTGSCGNMNGIWNMLCRTGMDRIDGQGGGRAVYFLQHATGAPEGIR